MTDFKNPGVRTIKVSPQTELKGGKLVDWLIELKREEMPDETEIVEELLDSILNDEIKLGIEITSFQYKYTWCKTDEEGNVYNLQVFRQIDDTLESLDNGGLSPTPGPTPKRPPSFTEFPPGVLNITENN